MVRDGKLSQRSGCEFEIKYIYMINSQQRNNRVFGALLLLTEIVLIFMFGFFIAYAAAPTIQDDYYIIAALLILAICGFGLIATYVKSVSVVSLAHVIIILGLSAQLYFPFRGFWEIIGVTGRKWLRNDDDILPVSVTNVLNDRQSNQMLQSSPLTDFIACFISLIIGYSAVIGRIGNLQVYFLTVVGTFIYEFVSMLFWRIMVTDCGFGMRIFLFGGCFALFASLVLGKKQTTAKCPRIQSDYYIQSLNLFGAIVIWSLLPVLSWSDLWHTSTVGRDSSILHIVSLNMWLALCGSAVGAVCGTIVVYRKLSAHTLVFSVFTGGIAYSSVADINVNPGAAIGIGMLTGFVCSLMVSKFKLKLNEDGVRDTNGVLFSYLIPGLIAGVLSAIFQARGFSDDYLKVYGGNIQASRTRFGQGGIQIAGLGIAVGLGIFAGLVAGQLMKIFNNRQSDDQFSETNIVNQVAIQKAQPNTA